MKVVIVGTGNVATQLTKQCLNLNIDVEIRARHRHNTIFSECTHAIDHPISKDTNLVVLCISDSSIASVCNILTLEGDNTVLAHTSGATPMSILHHPKCSSIGVFYPLQTIRKNATLEWKNIPICITANEDYARNTIKKLAHKLSIRVVEITDDQRASLHLSAVITNNFFNHLCVLASDLLKKNDLDFSLLSSLLSESIAKVTASPPDLTQTGPAKRNDQVTISRHINMMKDDPKLLSVYVALTQSIQNYENNNKNS
jgi:predicted short-subunit dehydrogenase-like oxidoreductase (DUF2520 family)